jgi:large subunit ribosomal protein L10
MDQPRPEKVAVVDEVRERMGSSKAVLLTEYRGINVDDMARLRRSLRDAGGEYKIYKNTLVRLATRDLGVDLDEMLVGPTAIAFVPDTEGADPAVVAKALKAFAKDNPFLVVKGGLLGERILTTADTKALADVPPREELLARFAGGLAAPMSKFASLLGALPRNFAYGLAALVAQGGAPGAPEPAAVESSDDAAEPAAAEAGEDTPVAEAAGDAAADAGDTTEAAGATEVAQAPEAATDAAPDDSDAPSDVAEANTTEPTDDGGEEPATETSPETTGETEPEPQEES